MICERNVKFMCCEDISLIENYEEAINSPERWDCHHRLESEHELFRPTRQQLINNGLYWKRPADELIFMKRSDHCSLHCKLQAESKTGIKSKESCRKQSETLKSRYKNGLISPSKGKPVSEETKEKIRQSLLNRYEEGYVCAAKGKPKSEETKEKIRQSLLNRYKEGYVCPTKGKHMPEERRKRISETLKKRNKS